MGRPDEPSIGSTVLRRVRTRAWSLLLIAALLLSGAGWWTHAAVSRRVRSQVAGGLTTLRDANASALRLWLREERRSLGQVARAAEVGAAVGAIVRGEGTAAAIADLRSSLAAMLGSELAASAIVVRPDGSLISLAAAEDGDLASGRAPLVWPSEDLAERVLAGESGNSRMQVAGVSGSVGAGGSGAEAAAVAWFGAVVALPGGTAGIMVRRELRAVFDSVLETARVGASGESYVVASEGAIVSASRFDEQLRRVGLSAGGGADRGPWLEARNPGVNLLAGLTSPLPRAQQPLTRMAAAGLAGESGVDVDGYRDYRGVPVVGAWTWIPELGVVLASEIDATEAYDTLLFLRQMAAGAIGLLLVAAVAVFYHGQVVARLGSRAARNRRLGKYVLEHKVGEGGMGEVYRARHAMLRRPTAIKLIRPATEGRMMRARFEREVQTVSALTHPNTVAVYDYGRTTDGVFYYAMEYLDGLSLRALVELDGPQPAGRVVHLLRQVCGSLAEAHDRGLVHRDIKPANIMVCERGGIADFVKVLDFGLVREIEQPADGLTADHVVGTPDYLSPEAIRAPAEVDARSDIYQLGLVAYFLLTGRRVFEGPAMAVVGEHLKTTPEPPSRRTEVPIPHALEQIVLRCLEKDPDDRPASARELDELLAGVPVEDGWSESRARSWWDNHAESTAAAAAFSTTLLSVDLDSR